MLPGSHHLPFHNALDRGRQTEVIDITDRRLPGWYPLESDPGDVLVFRHSLLHSSFGGWPGQRMMGLNFMRPEMEWHEVSLKGHVEANLPHMKAGQRIYSKRLVETAGPRRKRRLQKLMDLGYCREPRRPLTHLHYQFKAPDYGPSTYGELTSVPVVT